MIHGEGLPPEVTEEIEPELLKKCIGTSARKALATLNKNGFK